MSNSVKHRYRLIVKEGKTVWSCVNGYTKPIYKGKWELGDIGVYALNKIDKFGTGIEIGTEFVSC